jgi:hypothetical protein
MIRTPHDPPPLKRLRTDVPPQGHEPQGEEHPNVKGKLNFGDILPQFAAMVLDNGNSR